jgi:protein-disulfide isomerase
MDENTTTESVSTAPETEKKQPRSSRTVLKYGVCAVIFLVIGLALGSVMAGSITGYTVSETGDTDIGSEAVGSKLVSFLQNQLSARYPGIEIAVADITEYDPMPSIYEVTLNITFQGQSQDVLYYVTKDGTIMFSGATELTDQQSQPSQQPSEPSEQVSADDDPFKGDENAPVTIIEFSDFQCPYCGRHYRETIPQIEENYINTGKVKYVFRDFMLSFHPQAIPSALAAQCAHEQGKFWEYHDKLYDNQDSLSIENYKVWAAELDLNTEQFNSCLDSEKYMDEIQKDFADGQAAGVSGTPGFFINGQKLVGAQPYSVFEAAIEAALAA